MEHTKAIGRLIFETARKERERIRAEARARKYGEIPDGQIDQEESAAAYAAFLEDSDITRMHDICDADEAELDDIYGL